MSNKTFDHLIKTVHAGTNPYAGYERIAGDWPSAHWGQWGSGHGWFPKFIGELKPGLIIEVGSFLGGSAITMGETLKALGLNDSAILCVDTWLAEEILWSMPEHREKLRITYGTPCFYYTFLSNIIDKSLQGTVAPLRMPSVSAARYIRQLGLTAELIYIDGCHEEGDVIRDLEMYWPLLAPGGVMLIDDYAPEVAMFKGLVRDVDTFAKDNQLEVEQLNEKVALRKPKAG